MFSQVPSILRRSVDDLKEMILWQDELRQLLQTKATIAAVQKFNDEPLAKLLGNSPDKISWKMFDHYASISRIYGLYENAIFELIEEFLLLTPSVMPDYQQLPERIRTQHRIGVGQVLTKWNPEKAAFQALPEDGIASGLADGLRSKEYSLLANAYFLAPDNLRTNALNRLFSDLGFENAFAFISKFATMEEFLRNRFSNLETAESLLNQIVEKRNEAAHGSEGELVSYSTLINYADFILLIVDIISGLLLSRVARWGATSGKYVEVGSVVHIFSNKIVGVRSSSSSQIKVGDEFVAVGRDSKLLKVVSLKIIKQTFNEIDLKPNMEFGIQFDRSVTNNSRLIRCH
jgi:hypothetical protein